jgi:hypothetical protein
MITTLLLVIAGIIYASFPVVANVYAWKHDKLSGYLVSGTTVLTIISLLLCVLLLSTNRTGSAIVEILFTIFTILTVLGMLSFPVLANVYAWKHDKLSGYVVSGATAFMPLLLLGAVLSQKSLPINDSIPPTTKQIEDAIEYSRNFYGEVPIDDDDNINKFSKNRNKPLTIEDLDDINKSFKKGWSGGKYKKRISKNSSKNR